MARMEAMSARQEAAMARVEAERARIEARVARVRMMPVAFNTLEIPVVACPRVRVNVPSREGSAGAHDSGSGGAASRPAADRFRVFVLRKGGRGKTAASVFLWREMGWDGRASPLRFAALSQGRLRPDSRGGRLYMVFSSLQFLILLCDAQSDSLL